MVYNRTDTDTDTEAEAEMVLVGAAAGGLTWVLTRDGHHRPRSPA